MQALAVAEQEWPMLNEERRHRVVSEHREINGSRHGTTALSLVTTRAERTHEANSGVFGRHLPK